MRKHSVTVTQINACTHHVPTGPAPSTGLINGLAHGLANLDPGLLAAESNAPASSSPWYSYGVSCGENLNGLLVGPWDALLTLDDRDSADLVAAAPCPAPELVVRVSELDRLGGPE